MQRIAPAIVAFCKHHPDAIFAYMGDAALFARCFGEIPAAQIRSREFGPYEDYLDFVSTLDAGIAPLGASGFNACRTDTKFATYAARGVAAVLEDSEVYRAHAGRAIVFKTPAELDAALESLYADPARRARLADQAFEWAARERSPERLRAQRIAAYEQLLSEQTIVHAPIEASRAHAELSAASVLTDADAAVAALEGIVAEWPRYDQARLGLYRRYESRGDQRRARELLEDVDIQPLFANVAAELRARLAPRGEAGDARVSLETLLQRQPYNYVALANTIRDLLANEPASPALPELCLRACLIAPELVPVEHRPAALRRYLPA